MRKGWEIKTVGNVCKSASSNVSQNSLDSNIGEYPIYGASGLIKKVDFYHRDIPYLSIVKDGSGFGRITIMSAYTSVIGTLQYIIPNEEIDLNYLYYNLLSIDFKKYVSGAAIPHIYFKDYKTEPFLWMPIKEQRELVAIIDDAFESIERAKSNAEQNLKNAKELFESYLQNIFENKGEDWDEIVLEEVTDLISKGSSPKWQGIKYVDEPGVLFITSENVGENTLILKERKYVEEKFNQKEKKSILKNGDVLTNIVGASIGRTAIFNLDENSNINQAVCLIRCKNSILNNEFLTYLLNSPFVKIHLHENEVNNARANLSLGFFRGLVIPLPKLEVQKTIVEKIKSFHLTTKEMEVVYQKKINNIIELKKSILQKAFNGELKTSKISA